MDTYRQRAIKTRCIVEKITYRLIIRLIAGDGYLESKLDAVVATLLEFWLFRRGHPLPAMLFCDLTWELVITLILHEKST